MQSTSERFFAKVRRTEDGCWIWQGSKRNGYGQLKVGGRMVGAHRWAFEQVYGEMPEGYESHHLCGNKPCVYPGHIEAGTRKEHFQHHPNPNGYGSKTHCKSGHLLDDRNTIPRGYRPTGGRACRRCYRERMYLAALRRPGQKNLTTILNVVKRRV